MNYRHYIGIALFILVGYLIGVKYPAFGSSAIAKVSSAV